MPSPDHVTPGEERKLTRLAKDLKHWAKVNGRDFPWRSSEAKTYQQAVVEVLLQRTTATAVAGFFRNLRCKVSQLEPAGLGQGRRPRGLPETSWIVASSCPVSPRYREIRCPDSSHLILGNIARSPPSDNMYPMRSYNSNMGSLRLCWM